MTQVAWVDGVTDVSATMKHPVGVRRIQNGREYIYQKAGAAISVNQLVKLDASNSPDGLQVIPTAAAGDSCYGVAEVAIPNGSYGWITVRGVAAALVANGTAIDDPLGASGTAGTGTKLSQAGTGDFVFVRGYALEANSSGSAAAKRIYLL